jgi:hypothetical protein
MAAKEEMIHAPQLQIARVQSPAHSFEQLERIAEYVAQSRMIGGIENKAQAMTLMLLSQAEGRHPLEAQQRYHMVKGRPSKKAEAMLADFIESGGNVEFHERSETRCDATFTHVSVKEPVRVTWTIDMARTAQLMGNDGWKKYPRAMLHARTVSEGVRAVYPKACHGMYTPQEVEDMVTDRFEHLPHEESPKVITIEQKRESRPGEALEPIPQTIGALPVAVMQACFARLNGLGGLKLTEMQDDDLELVIDEMRKQYAKRAPHPQSTKLELEWYKAIAEQAKAILGERNNPPPPEVEQ